MREAFEYAPDYYTRRFARAAAGADRSGRRSALALLVLLAAVGFIVLDRGRERGQPAPHARRGPPARHRRSHGAGRVAAARRRADARREHRARIRWSGTVSLSAPPLSECCEPHCPRIRRDSRRSRSTRPCSPRVRHWRSSSASGSACAPAFLASRADAQDALRGARGVAGRAGGERARGALVVAGSRARRSCW